MRSKTQSWTTATSKLRLTASTQVARTQPPVVPPATMSVSTLSLMSTLKKGPVEGARVTLVDHNVPFLGSERLDNGRSFGFFQVLGRASECFCCKTVKGNGLLDLPGVNDRPFFAPESTDEGSSRLWPAKRIHRPRKATREFVRGWVLS